MSAGVSKATANAMLNTIGTIYVQMHIGDPGVSGTSNIALISARAPGVLTTSTEAIRVLASPVDWPSGNWTGLPQSITHVTVWSAATAGTFIFSVALGTHVDFVAGLLPRLNSLSISIPSMASD